ncbi:MAG: VCBS repeat-containing protein [Candidatus Thermoplasmatota archaeon]|nr:VCBS repeat-containing protein [Candidatus Thermoplasmatota archaeon]
MIAECSLRPRRTENMNFDVRKRKSWKEDEGVSEIIGNILILMITIILFSGIMAFVQQMPVPEQATKADFSASVSFSPSGTTANLTVTHAGGAVMKTKDTFMLVDVNNLNTRYDLSNPVYGLKNTTQWSTGQSWTVALTDTSYTSSITVTVVDNVKHSAVWSSQVTGGSGRSPPNILQRYVDSDPTTPTADPVREWQDFSLFVTIVDPDNNLDTDDGIWIDSSQLETDSPGASHRTPQPPSGNIFRWDFSDILTRNLSARDLDGQTIMIHAWDQTGFQSVSTFVMTVTQLPTDTQFTNKTIEIQGGAVGEGGLPAYLTWSSPASGQGFGIYEEDHSAPGVANTSKPKTLFVKDETVFVRVASLRMTNILGANIMVISDTRTGGAYAVNYNLSSTRSAPFYPYAASSSAFVYEAKFYTDLLPPGSYTLEIVLSSHGAVAGTFERFETRQYIVIGQEDSPVSFIPGVWLFKDAARTILWGGKTMPFDISGGTFMVYASVKVIDAQASPAPYSEEVRVTDMTGGSQLYGKPGYAGPMISALSRANATAYKFDVDLRYSNGNQWFGGTGAYTLLMAKFSDANEGVYSLSQQIFIKADGSRADFLLGEDGVNVGHQNFDVRGYLTYIENNNFFTRIDLFNYQNTPTDKTTYEVLSMAVGDLSGDGSKDMLTGQKGGELLYYRNSINSLGTWQDGSRMPRPVGDPTNNIKWITVGDINGDGAQDFAYVSSSGATANRIVIYNNTYGMTPVIYKDYGATVVRKIMLSDMNGDGMADLIILAGAKIYVHDLSKWGTALPVEIAKIPDPDTTSGITDFDVADTNLDGRPDILTVGTGGAAAVNGVWVNNYTNNLAPNNKLLDDTLANWIPRLVSGKVIGGTTVTNTKIKDGIALKLAENQTQAPIGSVDARMKFLTTLGNDPQQVLFVNARLLATNTEVFYVWYSTDAGGYGAYTLAFTINNLGGAFVNYTFSLPSTVANKNFYLRITDSSTSTAGTHIDQVEIDSVGVLSSIFGKYTTSRYQVVSDSPTVYTCVRAANIDGRGYLETVVAKDGLWKVYTNKTVLSGWSFTDANFYVRSSNALMTYSAPTLFDATDINGDGYTDILVCNVTAVQGSLTHVGFFMNLYPSTFFFTVTDLGVVGGSGAITYAAACNLYK